MPKNSPSPQSPFASGPQLNSPHAAGAPTPVDVQAWLKTIAPETFSSVEQFQALWNHPMSQTALELIQDDEFRSGFNEMRAAEQGRNLLILELGFIVLVWILQAWRLSKAANWASRIWVQAYMFGVLLAGTLFLVPIWIYGKPFQTVMSHGIRAFVRHFV